LANDLRATYRLQLGPGLTFADVRSLVPYLDRLGISHVYVSPALQADQRALTIEAVVPNPTGALKPGFFATARIEQPAKTPGIVVPAAAVLSSGGTARVFVVNGDRVEERIVTTGQTAGDLVEITRGRKAGERVATKNVAKLVDGSKVQG